MKVSSFGARMGIATIAWVALALFLLLGGPPTAHGAPGASVVTAPAPPAVDPGEWFRDARTLFGDTVAQLRNQKMTQSLSAADIAGMNVHVLAARTRCLTVSTEYNKRASKIKVGAKARGKPGRDADGAHNGYALTDDFFEKRGLPRTLDARECQLAAT